MPGAMGALAYIDDRTAWLRAARPVWCLATGTAALGGLRCRGAFGIRCITGGEEKVPGFGA